jgi:hypothetical protein
MKSNYSKEAHGICDAEIDGLNRTKGRLGDDFNQTVELILGTKGESLWRGAESLEL